MDCGADEQAKQQNGGHGGAGDDPAEWKKVGELRAVVEAQDPASKVIKLISSIHPPSPHLLLEMGNWAVCWSSS